MNSSRRERANIIERAEASKAKAAENTKTKVAETAKEKVAKAAETTKAEVAKADPVETAKAAEAKVAEAAMAEAREREGIETTRISLEGAPEVAGDLVVVPIAANARTNSPKCNALSKRCAENLVPSKRVKKPRTLLLPTSKICKMQTLAYSKVPSHQQLEGG